MAEILIVDDEKDIRDLIAGILEDEGYTTRQAGSADEALETISKRPPQLVVLDIWLEGSRLDGLGILAEIHKTQPDMPVIMISGHGTVEVAMTAMRHGASDFIEKPFQSDRLLMVIAKTLESFRMRQENMALRQRAGVADIIDGMSPAIQQLRGTIERVAKTSCRVLITGAPGSGKEVVARLIHRKSERTEGPFVVINCASMQPDRLETELFGTETGQGGKPRKIGVLEQANGGTLLLDEVADMPIETQGKIVRALQNLTFERVGGNSRVEVDVRVIASSARDLQEEMDSGRFRQDLFFRLNVVPLHVPSLNQRIEDIPVLARMFLEQFSATSGNGGGRVLAEDAITAMQMYAWPGNVRQLRNVLEWLIIMGAGGSDGTIHAAALPPEITQRTTEANASSGGAEIMSLPLRDAREQFERDYLTAQLSRFGGNISKTATFVGMERSALHRKLKSLGMAGGEEANP
ncbi:MAG: sigma-54-dependent Fis family transcriptional regulator [Alphaproteobacteria bacterium GWF2_58_20]|nr:MAG: sigma-54-dependent Fis family transcriptional regulator [Alphaproteobacteria bacterium GWF2_58_20]